MYTISFDFAAIFLAFILVMIHIYLFDNEQKTNWMFHYFAISAAVEAALNVFTALIIDQVVVLPDILCVWFNELYYFVTFITAYLGFNLVMLRLYYNHKLTKVLTNANLVIAMIVMLINGFTGIFFYFENGKYIKTIYFPCIYIFSFVFLIFVPNILYVKRRVLSMREKIAPAFFIFILIFTFVLQMLMPKILLTGFGKALAAMVFCLYLETPEHIQLKLAVSELEKLRQEQLISLKQLEEANQEKADFLISMSHRLRTPINVILGFTDVLMNESGDEKIKEDAHSLNIIGLQLLFLAEDIVDFSQIETGKLEIREAEYEHIEAMLIFKERMAKIVNKYNLKFTLSSSTDIPKRMYGDNIRICQMIEEIIKYSMRGKEGAEISVAVNVDHIEENYVFLSFAISNNLIKYEKLGNDDSDADYVVVKKLLECMGCEYSYTYTRDAASTFTLVFRQEIVDLKSVGDLNEAEKKAIIKAHKENANELFVMQTAKILVVDDTAVNLKVFENMVAPYRLQLTTAESGKKALEYMSSNKYDLVFMDILMPEMDGIETLKEIRNREEILSKDVPVIALTANVFIGAKDKYLADGFADYVTKPIHRESVADTLKKFLPDKIEKDWAELNVTDEDMDIDSAIYREPSVEKKTITFDDVPGLSLEQGLTMCMGDMDLYMEILRDYCSNETSIKLDAFYEAEDWDNYRILIHGAKSTAKTIGLNSLSEAAKALELAAKEQDVDFIHANHKQWTLDYDSVIAVMKQLI